MPYTAVEIIALILVVLTLIKIIIVLFSKKSWLKVSSGIYDNGKVWSWIALVLAAVVLYYLLQSMTIVSIMAAAAFTALLMAFAFLQYAKEMKTLATKMLKQKLSGGLIFYIIIWLALVLWTGYTILF